MSSDAEIRDACKFFPLAQADATGWNGLFRKAITNASQSFAIPSGLRGKWLRLATTGNVQFAFGNGAAAPTLVYDQAADLGTGHVSAGPDLFAFMIEEGRIPNDATYIAWIGPASASGFISGFVSEKPA